MSEVLVIRKTNQQTIAGKNNTIKYDNNEKMSRN